jgi:hypothetical protein
MEGNITKFRADLGLGVIQGNDGRKYRFASTDIRNPHVNLVGHEVDFMVESLKPRSIVVLHGSPWFAFGRAGALEKRR